jgi:hypothetical protein
MIIVALKLFEKYHLRCFCLVMILGMHSYSFAASKIAKGAQSQCAAILLATGKSKLANQELIKYSANVLKSLEARISSSNTLKRDRPMNIPTLFLTSQMAPNSLAQIGAAAQLRFLNNPENNLGSTFATVIRGKKDVQKFMDQMAQATREIADHQNKSRILSKLRNETSAISGTLLGSYIATFTYPNMASLTISAVATAYLIRPVLAALANRYSLDQKNWQLLNDFIQTAPERGYAVLVNKQIISGEFVHELLSPMNEGLPSHAVFEDKLYRWNYETQSVGFKARKIRSLFASGKDFYSLLHSSVLVTSLLAFEIAPDGTPELHIRVHTVKVMPK